MSETSWNVADELSAIKAVADALEPLSDASRRHVIAYVADALSIASAPAQTATTTRSSTAHLSKSTSLLVVSCPRTSAASRSRSSHDPRTRCRRWWRTTYLAAFPTEERRAVITAADIEKYFKQANFRLPSRVAQTLPDAARLWYFDTMNSGQYRLNPVGTTWSPMDAEQWSRAPPHVRLDRERPGRTLRRARRRAPPRRRLHKKAAGRRKKGTSGARTKKASTKRVSKGEVHRTTTQDTAEWSTLLLQLDALRKEIGSHGAATVGRQATRDHAKAVVQQYFRLSRPHLVGLEFTAASSRRWVLTVQELLRLREWCRRGRLFTRRSSVEHARELDQVELSEMRLGVVSSNEASPDPPSSVERSIIKTLSDLDGRSCAGVPAGAQRHRRPRIGLVLSRRRSGTQGGG